jgi:hypothetical protein
LYHIGIVEHIISPTHKGVISADETVQAVVRMWDENLLILPVHKKIVRKIRKGDYVLNDYTPMSPTSRYRNLFVVKIIPEKDGKKIWDEFKGELQRRKVMIKKMEPTSPQVRYIR